MPARSRPAAAYMSFCRSRRMVGDHRGGIWLAVEEACARVRSHVAAESPDADSSTVIISSWSWASRAQPPRLGASGCAPHVGVRPKRRGFSAAAMTFAEAGPELNSATPLPGSDAALPWQGLAAQGTSRRRIAARVAGRRRRCRSGSGGYHFLSSVVGAAMTTWP